MKSDHEPNDTKNELDEIITTQGGELSVLTEKNSKFGILDYLLTLTSSIFYNRLSSKNLN